MAAETFEWGIFHNILTGLVYMSVTLVYCVETAKLTIKLFYRPGGPIILVFLQETRL